MCYHTTENSLGEARRGGDGVNREERAFVEELYRSMLPSLLAYGRAARYDASVVHDAAQETFLVVCERVETVMAHESPEGWVASAFKLILRRAGQNRARNLALLERLERENLRADAVKSDERDPVLLYGDLAKNEDFRLLCRLTERGCTLAELAAEMGISAAACEKRVQRARKRLQKYFENF